MMKTLILGGIRRRAWVRRKARTARGAAVRAAASRASSGLRVLVVDDNADAAELFSEILREAGYVVDVAADGIEALACALRSPPDVALVDIGLPGIDGYELARRLRAACPGCFRLIALTGYGPDRERSCAAGFDLHLSKPIDIDGLKRAIEP